ncbi:MAG: HDOD domain-containing protein [Desulfobacterales bacterium]
MQREVIKRLESINNLPTLPAVIENLADALQDPEVDVEQIAGIIEDDPAIMARIMKVVNSSIYLGVRETMSLRRAIVRLGFRAVTNIAMSAAVFSTFPPASGAGFDRAGFWKHCICTGVAAEVVNRHAAGLQAPVKIDKDALHLCGLLHDIGKIIFEQYFHDSFMEALEMSRKQQIPLAEAEFRVLGTDHAQAGAWLARTWNLSEEVTAVIRWHHSPEGAEGKIRELVRICSLADLVVNAGGLGRGGNGFNKPEEDFAGEFDLPAKDLLKIISLTESGAAESPLLEMFESHGAGAPQV